MCGRYELDIDEDRLIKRFAIKRDDVGFKRRYNIAPSQVLPIITEEEPDAITLASWGLRPFWAKPDRKVLQPINARAETVDTATTFRRAFRERRCLVPATAFFEWQKREAGKQPFRIARADGEAFAFAGVFEGAPHGEAGTPSYAIITTEPNDLMAPIHNRMPVILAPDEEADWLNPDTPEERLKTLLRPYPARALDAYPVSRLVNSPSNDTPAVHEPVTT